MKVSKAQLSEVRSSYLLEQLLGTRSSRGYALSTFSKLLIIYIEKRQRRAGSSRQPDAVRSIYIYRHIYIYIYIYIFHMSRWGRGRDGELVTCGAMGLQLPALWILEIYRIFWGASFHSPRWLHLWRRLAVILVSRVLGEETEQRWLRCATYVARPTQISCLRQAPVTPGSQQAAAKSAANAGYGTTRVQVVLHGAEVAEAGARGLVGSLRATVEAARRCRARTYCPRAAVGCAGRSGRGRAMKARWGRYITPTARIYISIREN